MMIAGVRQQEAQQLADRRIKLLFEAFSDHFTHTMTMVRWFPVPNRVPVHTRVWNRLFGRSEITLQQMLTTIQRISDH